MRDHEVLAQSEDSLITTRQTTRARREEIIALVRAGETGVEALSAVLGVSASTIRRDLAELRRDGRVTRTYGGALLSGRTHESSVSERTGQAWREKQLIAERALHFVSEGDTVFLDGGTTVGNLLRGLREFSSLTVITNSLSELQTLLDSSFTVILLGGEIRRTSQSTVGPITAEALSRLSADHAFLGADGVVAGRGICEADLNQTVVKETMARNAGRAYVLADSSKLGIAPFNAWAPLPSSYTLITDDSASDRALKPFLATAGVDVIIVSDDLENTTA
jgi:DeoR/GlpR family transcriptional regulator of sugar metabolism